MIRVQEQAFDAGGELMAFKAGKTHVGGTALFVGSVREMNEGAAVSAMASPRPAVLKTTEPAAREASALGVWQLDAVLIIHRFGRMLPGDDIVLVLCSSSHREAAFEACQFLMDWLKTRAPFWKLEEGGGAPRWVDARESDDWAASRWSKT